MVPLSHIVWAACWLGIARRATATAQAQYKAKRRVDQNAGFGGELLSTTVAELRAFHSLVEVAAEEYDRLVADPTKWPVLRSARYAVRMNGLKMTASRHVTNICLSCLEVCGMTGYLEDSQYSISRMLRDGLSSLVMVNNQRLVRTNAKLLEVLEPNDRNYLD
jgi:acyl-CoA dehydrogenase